MNQNLSRSYDRSPLELRPIRFIRSPQKDPAGSVMVEWGDTKVLCSAILEDKLPNWMTDNRAGWITAEYSMLPGSSDKRVQRDRVRSNGRTHEIQRLIGRSLRACVDLKRIPGRSLLVDCDVIQADGGTRVASITGAYLAIKLAFDFMLRKRWVEAPIATVAVAAVSVGRTQSKTLVDLDFKEDSSAEMDANIVMNERGEFIELQATAEKSTFKKSDWDEALAGAEQACQKLFQLQRAALAEWKLV